VNVKVYVEGGGDNEDTITRCRRAFGAYCAKVVHGKPHPRIVPCGGRNQTFEKFKNGVRTCPPNEVCILLVDSEGPVQTSAPVAYLSDREGWDFPPLNRHSPFLMVQAMEAWFLADRETLAAFYGEGFLANSLPGNPRNIEVVRKGDLEQSLRHASKRTKTKGEYHKVKHGFALLALIDPRKVEASSPHAAAFHHFLRTT
jgi:hypothetical protein